MIDSATPRRHDRARRLWSRVGIELHLMRRDGPVKYVRILVAYRRFKRAVRRLEERP